MYVLIVSDDNVGSVGESVYLFLGTMFMLFFTANQALMWVNLLIILSIHLSLYLFVHSPI